MKLTTALCVIIFFTSAWSVVEAYGRATRNGKTQKNNRNRLTIAVKTTAKFHESRATDIADTWFQLAPEKVFLFTDVDDNRLNKSLDGHLINTKCGKGHSRDQLNCKMSAELDLFTRKMAEWSCHFDDDNYVNIKALLDVLDLYDHNRDWYLGKSSTHRPVEIQTKNGKVSFWFATGGAGVCMSRALVKKMRKYVSKDGFVGLGSYLHLPDDMTLGFLINHKLGIPLTTVDRFHSHFEDLPAIPQQEIGDQVSLSAGSYDTHRQNFVAVPLSFPVETDRQRFRSLHCFLFPKRCPDAL